MTLENLQKRLKDAGLRITPQRVAVLEVLLSSNHPAADHIASEVRKSHPSIATGTIYKILETFVDRGIINKIETRSGVMRYDAILAKHHHLYDENGNLIEDYFDEELNQLVFNYLQKNKIHDFDIADVNIQIIGKYKNQ